MGILSVKKKRVSNKSTGRNYVREDKWESSPVQKKRRAARNKARRIMMAKGVVHKGDGLDIDHKNSNPILNDPNNLHALPASKNRSFPRTKKAKEKGGFRFGKRIVTDTQG